MRQRKKRLCVLIPTHWEAMMGGTQFQAKVLIEKLIATKEYEIYYLARRINPGSCPDGYTIIRIGHTRGIRRYTFLFDAPRLLSVLKQIRPDIIYQGVGCSYTGIAAYYAAQTECNMVWRIAHDLDVIPSDRQIRGNRLMGYIEKKILEYGIKRAKHIVTQTEYQSDLLQRYYGRTPTAVIRNFHPLPTEKINKTNPIKILWVANFKKFKQPEVFIRLAHDLQGITNARFIMIGSPPGDHIWHDELMRRIAQLQNLTYLGRQTQEDVNALLARSHILINTSTHEGFSNTFIQAWMRKVPIVSLNVNPDGVFSDTTIGFGSGSYEKMREDTRKLIENTTRRRAMGKRAQAYAFKKHSEKNIEALVKVFNK